MDRPRKTGSETLADFLLRLEAWSMSSEGIAAAEAERHERREREASDRSRLQRSLIREAEIPNRYVSRFHDKRPTTSPAMQAIAEGAMVIAGNPGCGKTTAACWWLMEFIIAPLTPRKAPRFTTAPAIARMNKFDGRQMGDLIHAPRLVIDDLGVEYSDERGAFLSLLDEIVDARYAAERPTLVTTNLADEDFAKRYDGRIYDRIRDAGGFYALDNPSMRGVG
jgi:DNA replication protein DnaC